MVPTGKRAGVYLRISEDREGRELGVDRQLDQCRLLAAALGWDIADVYVDNSKGASRHATKRRPQYERMLADARAGRITAIISLSTSRLTRRPRELEDLVDLVEAHGTEIRTVKVGKIDLGSAQGRMLARILAAADAAEAEVNSERSRDEREQRRQQGRWNGGPRPFGQRPNRSAPGGLVEVPAEADLIRTACRDLLDGRSTASITRVWQNSGVAPVAGGKKWWPVVVSEILAAPRLAALLPDGRPAAWPPIVDPDTWRGVAAILASPERSMRRGAKRLLTGIGRCGVCGETLNGGVSNSGAPTYRCVPGHHLQRQAGPVDRYVTDVLMRYLANLDLTVPEEATRTGNLARDAEGLRARLAELADLVADGAMTAAEYRPRADRLRAQLQAVETETSVALRGSVLAGLPLGLPDLRAEWDAHATDIEWRRQVLRAAQLQVSVFAPGRGPKAFDPATVVISGGR
jgi:site-specific DNA recombinase